MKARAAIQCMEIAVQDTRATRWAVSRECPPPGSGLGPLLDEWVGGKRYTRSFKGPVADAGFCEALCVISGFVDEFTTGNSLKYRGLGPWGYYRPGGVTSK